MDPKYHLVSRQRPSKYHRAAQAFGVLELHFMKPAAQEDVSDVGPTILALKKHVPLVLPAGAG